MYCVFTKNPTRQSARVGFFLQLLIQLLVIFLIIVFCLFLFPPGLTVIADRKHLIRNLLCAAWSCIMQISDHASHRLLASKLVCNIVSEDFLIISEQRRDVNAECRPLIPTLPPRLPSPTGASPTVLPASAYFRSRRMRNRTAGSGRVFQEEYIWLPGEFYR